MLGSVVAESVGLRAVTELKTQVCENLQVVVDLRGTPDLSRIQNSRVTCCDKRGRIITLDGAIRRIRLAVFKTEVGKTGIRQWQADIGCDAVLIAVAFAESTVLRIQRYAFGVVSKNEVQYAGNGVRTVLRRSAVTKDFDLLQCNRRNNGNVRSLCTVGNAVTEPVNNRSTMTALAVDQNQCVVRCEAAKVRRAHNRRCVTDGLGVDVIGGHDIANEVRKVRVALVTEIIC